jgi:hypothetical protein
MIIYQPANADSLDFSKGEKLATIEDSDRRPKYGEVADLGGDRLWRVIQIETMWTNSLFDEADNRLHVALCALESSPFEPWTAAWMRERSPDLSFFVQLSPAGDILASGYAMDGEPPIGRLFGAVATDHPTLLQEVPLPWFVDTVDTYRGDYGESGALFSAVHICHCKAVSVPELAIA